MVTNAFHSAALQPMRSGGVRVGGGHTCSVVQCVAECCRVLQRVAVRTFVPRRIRYCHPLQHGRVLQCVAVRRNVLQCAVVCCSVAVCCNALQRVAARTLCQGRFGIINHFSLTTFILPLECLHFFLSFLQGKKRRKLNQIMSWL